MRLTPIQKERLLNRDKPEYASVKRTNDYLVREALKDFLDLEDVNLILKNLPKEQIENVISDEHIDKLLELAERLYGFLGPGYSSYYEVPYEGQPIDTLVTKKKVAAKISARDARRAGRLNTHISRLKLEKEKRKYFAKIYENLEGMTTKGLKVAYKKKDYTKKNTSTEEKEQNSIVEKWMKEIK